MSLGGAAIDLQEGDVIHGTTSCGNVYRILLINDGYMLARVEKMEKVPYGAYDDPRVGKLIIRAIGALSAHHERDCPNA